MSNTDGHTKTLRFSDDLDGKLAKVAKKLRRSKLQLFGQMVEYFIRTGKDPADISDEVLKTTLLKNHDTYIRFIRAQEEKILIPVRVEVDRMIQSQLKIIDFFNKQVLAVNRELLDGQEAHSDQLTETEKMLQTITEKLDTKESLKLKFLYILNNYAKTRESFGFTTPAKEKEELLSLARQQLAKL